MAARSLSLALAYEETGLLYVSDEVWYVNTARKILVEVFGYRDSLMQVSSLIEDYYNLEHPPLGKYIIGASMVLCGDQPICWRLPGIIEASLIPVILAWGFRFRYPMAPAVAAAAAADPVLAAAGSVAMLDVHLAFFTALALALLIRGHAFPASIAAGAALSVKMSGIPLVVVTVFYTMARRGLYFSLATLLAAVLVYTLAWMPIALYLGVDTVVAANIGAVSYHTTPRPENGPPKSSPLGWVFNTNPFYYSVGAVTLPAVTSTLIHMVAIASALVLMPASIRRGLSFTVASITLLSIYAAYYLVMAAGNTTLYSFYSVQLTPAAAAVIGEVLFYVASTERR